MVDGALVVRAWCADDAAALAAMYALDRRELEVSEPWRKPEFFTVEGQRDRIARVWAEHRTLGFVAVQGDQLAGLCVLEDVTSDSAIVGYYVASSHRRRGFATRALALLIGIAFDDVGVRTLMADIRPDNTASREVAERNGFCYVEGVSIDGVDLHRLVLSCDDASEALRARTSPP